MDNSSSSTEHQSNPLATVKHIIAIGSGKGGVGKSTVAALFAVGLKLGGRTVAQSSTLPEVSLRPEPHVGPERFESHQQAMGKEDLCRTRQSPTSLPIACPQEKQQNTKLERVRGATPQA